MDRANCLSSSFIKTSVTKDSCQGTSSINFWCSHFIWTKITLEANAMKYLCLLLVWYLGAICIDVESRREGHNHQRERHQMSPSDQCLLRHGQSLPLFPKDCGRVHHCGKRLWFRNCNNLWNAINFSARDASLLWQDVLVLRTRYSRKVLVYDQNMLWGHWIMDVLPV